MSNFAKLKTSSDLGRLTKEIEKFNSPTENADESNYWKLERDKSGNGSAVIRFLPAPAVDGDDALPWVRYWDHGFKGPKTGLWYIENSRTTIGEKDPVSEYNSRLWNESSDDNSPQRKQARDQKRRLHYVSNILVVSDPKHPENEGKVFLFKYGKKIFDKINLAMNPEFDGDKPVNPFDMWKGANFKLRMRTVAGYPNYDESSWESPSAISDNDEKLEAIWKSEYSLKEIIAPDKFKSYEELAAKLERVLADTTPAPRSTAGNGLPTVNTRKVVDEEEDPPFDVSDEDDELSQFRALAEG